MEAIKRYLLFGDYPPCILCHANPDERKSRKKQFRNMTSGFKIIHGQLPQLKIRRKFKDSSSESKLAIFGKKLPISVNKLCNFYTYLVNNSLRDD